MERPAALRATWARGHLRVAYRGPCYCSKDVVPHCVEINQCVPPPLRRRRVDGVEVDATIQQNTP